jgi:hypothetical protein
LLDLENILHCFDVIAEWELVFSCAHAALHKIEYLKEKEGK